MKIIYVHHAERKHNLNYKIQQKHQQEDTILCVTSGVNVSAFIYFL